MKKTKKLFMLEDYYINSNDYECDNRLLGQEKNKVVRTYRHHSTSYKGSAIYKVIAVLKDGRHLCNIGRTTDTLHSILNREKKHVTDKKDLFTQYLLAIYNDIDYIIFDTLFYTSDRLSNEEIELLEGNNSEIARDNGYNVVNKFTYGSNRLNLGGLDTLRYTNRDIYDKIINGLM